jgi:tetratricopeptide (TPR) repeat protein
LGKEYAKEISNLSQSCEFDHVSDPKEFGEKVTDVLQKLTNDKHIKFRLIEASELGENKKGSLHHPVRYHRLGQKEHLGIFRLDWIENEIGYLDYRRFYNQKKAKKMLTDALRFLSRANAIIIDLRENGGGSGNLIPWLISYFLPHPTQLTGTYYRNHDLLEEWWTLERVEGKRLLDVPLFILIGKNTFSAAEYFAYDLKVRNRATLIGEVSKGGAHSVDLYPVGDNFEIYISTARAVNPVTGTNWEGAGIAPDIAVPSESALDTAIELAKEAAQEYGKSKDAKITEAVQRMQGQLDQAEKFFKENDVNQAESLLESAFQTGMQADLIDEFFIQVLAYHYSSLENYKMSIWLLEKHTQLYPENTNGYAALAWAYYKAGEKKLALKQCEKVLELDKRNSVAKRMLKELKQNF